MQIDFKAGDQNLRFKRNWFTGRAILETPDGSETLSSPYAATTHISLSLNETWFASFRSHAITIEKVRPLLMAGFRPQNYQIFVDGDVVASARGY